MLEDNDPVLIRTARIEKILGIELRSQIDLYYRVLENFAKEGKKKFNQMKDKLLASGYVPQNFSTDIPRFQKSFGGYFEYKKFMVDSTVDEIVTRFNQEKLDKSEDLRAIYLE